MGLGLGLAVLVSISALVGFLGIRTGLHGILGWELGTENYDLGALGRHFVTHSRYYGMEGNGL